MIEIRPIDERHFSSRLTLVFCLCMVGSGCAPRAAPPARQPEWGHAEAVWTTWARAHLEKVRQQMPGKDLEWVEYRSKSIRQFLLEYRIYVLAGYRVVSRSALFALSRSGQITDLGQGDEWGITKGRARNQRLTDFVTTQNIVLAEPPDALDCVRLIQDLAGASNLVTVSRINNVKFPDPLVFDKDQMRTGRNPANWKLTPRREGSTWIVTTEYVGPPASIGWPRTYELTVDADSRLVDLCKLVPFQFK